jgi:hypothetical protein
MGDRRKELEEGMYTPRRSGCERPLWAEKERSKIWPPGMVSRSSNGLAKKLNVTARIQSAPSWQCMSEELTEHKQRSECEREKVAKEIGSHRSRHEGGQDQKQECQDLNDANVPDAADGVGDVVGGRCDASNEAYHCVKSEEEFKEWRDDRGREKAVNDVRQKQRGSRLTYCLRLQNAACIGPRTVTSPVAMAVVTKIKTVDSNEPVGSGMHDLLTNDDPKYTPECPALVLMNTELAKF